MILIAQNSNPVVPLAPVAPAFGQPGAALKPNPPLDAAQTPAASQPPPPPASVQPPTTPAGAVGPSSAATEVVAFDIRVEAPPEVKSLLERHIELKRYQAVGDLDAAEWSRLLVLAERNVRNLVGTLGFFSPEIRIDRLEAGPGKPTVVINVNPGEATRIVAVDMDFAGDIATTQNAGAIAQRETLERSWLLPVGQPFTQNSWDGAKTQALRDLVTRRYPRGQIASSLADIDAPNRTAGLKLALDSGPLFRLGAMQISGVERFDPVLVSRLARLPVGSEYDQNAVVQAQLRLASSGYFDSATIFIDPEGNPEAVPVQVQVKEARLQKLILGVGITTDSGPRLSLEHTHLRLPVIGWRAATKLQLERKSPFAQTEWTSMPDEANWRWAVFARVERLDDDRLVTQGQQLRFGRMQNGDTIDRNISVQYDRASVKLSREVNLADIAASAATSNRSNAALATTGGGSALTANYVWTGRYFDSLPFVSRGYGLGFEIGGGTTLQGKRQPFTRLVGRWLGVLPLGAEQGRVALRAEAGGVFAADSARLPTSQLFRTGGDSSVRGYRLRSIGTDLGSGSGSSLVTPGRFMAVGSAEWQRPLKLGGLPSEFENTFFIDAGAVADKIQKLRPSLGIGTGVRWKSPIGPLQADIAYGLKAKRLRVHLSVGFVF